VDTWKKKENLKNTKELVEEFKREYGKDKREIRRQEDKEDREVWSRGSPERYTARLLYGWQDKEYEKRQEER